VILIVSEETRNRVGGGPQFKSERAHLYLKRAVRFEGGVKLSNENRRFWLQEGCGTRWWLTSSNFRNTSYSWQCSEMQKSKSIS